MEDFSLDAIANPALVEKRVLDAYEKHVTGGEGVIVDANNTFMFLVEMFSQLTSDATDAVLNKLNALYPQRALTPEDLYMHMSDYDYVGLFASPASLNMEMILGKQELIDNAVPVYENNREMNYRKIVIPDNTVFSIGNYTFGLYYPIEIRINNTTKAFSVVYDTSSDDTALNGKNPLTQLNVNTVEYAFQTFKDIEIVALRFPVYQYSKTVYLQDVATSSGFKQTYSFDNKFYAIRIYRSVNGHWKEINQTLSDTVYDPMTVTAKLMVDTENNTVTVSIPQIYFTSGLISSQLKMELYTTNGELDEDITNISQTQISCTFQDDKTGSALNEYSRPLDRAQTLQVYPIATKIAGGSNGYDFETLRSNVINNTFYSNVIARFASLQAKMRAEGFEVMKHEDSIMNRIFYCSKPITDLNGDIIASGSIPLHVSSNIANTVFDGSSIPQNYRWTRYRAFDQSFMVLPAALLKFNPDTGVSELVPDDEYPEELDRVADRAAAYNKYQYTYQPFHLRISMSNRYPVAYSYNLMNPSVDRIFFRGNNAALGESINGFTGTIIHKNGGTGGYTVRFAVTISENLEKLIDNVDMNDDGSYVSDVWLNDIIVYLKYSAPNEAAEGCFAILTPTTLRTEEGKYLFELDITTDYFINEDHYIEFGAVNQSLDGTNSSYGKISRNNRVPIQSDQWTLTFLLSKNVINNMASALGNAVSEEDFNAFMASASEAGIGAEAINDLKLVDPVNDYVPVSEQQVTLNFGSYMSQIHNAVEVFTGNKEYETYQDDVYVTNSKDTYLRDEYDCSTLKNSGNLVMAADGTTGKPLLQLFSQKHDWLLEDVVDTQIVKRIGVDQMKIEWNNSYLGGSYKQVDSEIESARNYVKYNDVSAGIDYLMSYNPDTDLFTTIDPSMAYAPSANPPVEVIIFNTDTKKTVLLTEDNIGDGSDDNDYFGKQYPICSYETKQMVYLELDAISSSVTKGISVIETPINASTGIRKIFNPGLTVYDIENDGEYYRVYLNNELLTSRGVRADVDDYKKLFSVPIEIPSALSTDKYKNLRVAFGSPLIMHNAGDNVLDAAGKPTVHTARSYEYYVNAIQLDARAYLGSDIDTNSLRKSISDMINTYAQVVDIYRPELLENTHLYYQPKRSIGYANFSVGNDVIKALPLQLATEFTLTVKSFVYEDDNLRELIEGKILEYVTEQIEDSVLSSTAISKRIMDNLSEYVDAVAVSGFNTKEDLSGALTTEEKFNAYQTQVIKVVDDDAKCSIRRIVYVDDRKLLATKRGLTINFVV